VAELTRPLIARHGMGRADAYDAALLDVAQDHLLYLLAEAGVFDDGSLTFKGGTSLRKCRLGNDGRFSTDLDFAAPDEDVVLAVCAIIDGNQIGGFQYRLEPSRGDGRHWDMKISHSTLGSPAIAASVEFARRGIALEPELLGFVPLPIHRHYGFTLLRVPVVAEAEACAEKLARYRRTSLGRDLYDLQQFANRSIDEALVRRLWVLKVWGDVVDDHRGDKPLDPADTLRPRRERDFHPDSLRVLTRPVDIPGWEARVRTRFQFIADLDADEARWAACDPRHRSEVDAALVALAS
jgi:uncharacterized protein